jgi:hypothetical protein
MQKAIKVYGARKSNEDGPPNGPPNEPPNGSPEGLAAFAGTYTDSNDNERLTLTGDTITFPATVSVKTSELKPIVAKYGGTVTLTQGGTGYWYYLSLQDDTENLGVGVVLNDGEALISLGSVRALGIAISGVFEPNPVDTNMQTEIKIYGTRKSN